jgi:hypothetical protein
VLKNSTQIPKLLRAIALGAPVDFRLVHGAIEVLLEAGLLLEFPMTKIANPRIDCLVVSVRRDGNGRGRVIFGPFPPDKLIGVGDIMIRISSHDEPIQLFPRHTTRTSPALEMKPDVAPCH